MAACGGRLPPKPERPVSAASPGKARLSPVAPVAKHPGRPVRRGALAAFSYALLALDLKDLFVAGNTGARTLHTAVYAVLLICLAILALAVSRKESPGEGVLLRGKLSKRTVMTLVVAILSIPLTLFLGPRYFHDRKYYVVSLLVLLEAMLPFFLIFEGRKPQARELVILAVLCGLAIGGRAAFFCPARF